MPRLQVNISQQLADRAKAEAKRRGFHSLAEFIRVAISYYVSPQNKRRK